MARRNRPSYVTARKTGGMTVEEIRTARIKREREEEDARAARAAEADRIFWEAAVQRRADESARQSEIVRLKEAAKQITYDMHEHRIATGWWKRASQ